MSEPLKLEVHELPMTAGGVVTWQRYYLAADVEQVIAELISTLRDLHAVQNGSPLPKYDHDWKAAMEDTERLLAEWETKP